MFDKVLASVRIGAAEVDTRLERTRLQPGEAFDAQVVVNGGEVDQEIDGLELALQADLREDTDEPASTRTIETWEIHEEFTIHEDEQRVIPIEGRIHPETPVTEVEARTLADVWIATGMDIESGIDASDKDYLQIEPTPQIQAMLQAIENAGFRLHEVTTDPDRIQVGDVQADLALDQEFGFKSTGSSKVTEVEIHFLPRQHQTHVLVEFDFRTRNEQFKGITIDNDDYSVDGLRRAFETQLNQV